jgi:hypothetical protein
MNLVKRTAPLPVVPKENTGPSAAAAAPVVVKEKVDPFGGAKAVVTKQPVAKPVEPVAAPAPAPAPIVAAPAPAPAPAAKKAPVAAPKAMSNWADSDSDSSDNDEPAAAAPAPAPVAPETAPVSSLQAAIAADAAEEEDDGFVTVSKPKKVSAKEKAAADAVAAAEKAAAAKKKKKDKRNKKLEAMTAEGTGPTLNTRAAALETAKQSPQPSPVGDGASPVAQQGQRAPAPTVNARFAKMMDEDKQTVTLTNNSDVAQGQGFVPPAPREPVELKINSRVMQAMDEDRVNRLPAAGLPAAPPPVVQNSRFAAAADADREFTAANRLPPRDAQPLAAANSRFARAAEEDREFQAQRREDRAPPVVQNSRFAAAADADRTNPESAFGRRDEPRGGGELRENTRAMGGRWGDDGGGDDFERRQNQQREIIAEAGQGRAQWGVPRDGGKSWAERHAEKNQGGEYQLSEPPQQMQREFSRAPVAQQPVSTAATAELFAKKEEKKVSGVIALPGETQEQAEARVAKAKQDKEDKAAAEKAAADKVAAEKEVAAQKAAAASAALANVEDDIIAEFASGSKLGKDLAKWVKEQKAKVGKLPSLYKMVLAMLKKQQGASPDIDCKIFSPERYGAAMLAMAGEDRVEEQMQYMFAVQAYCNGIGFPKVGGKSYCAAAFTALYKYDLVETEAQLEYKEDEAEEHEAGKQTVMIQCINWFNFLEEDSDEEESDDDEE